MERRNSYSNDALGLGVIAAIFIGLAFLIVAIGSGDPVAALFAATFGGLGIVWLVGSIGLIANNVIDAVLEETAGEKAKNAAMGKELEEYQRKVSKLQTRIKKLKKTSAKEIK